MDAIGVWRFHSDIFPRTVSTLVKWCPPEIPIYIMDQTAPYMLKQREQSYEVAAQYPDRVEVCECFVSTRRDDGPRSIIKFLELHPEINRLLKIDDDCIVAQDIYTGLKEAYEHRDTTLFAAALSTVQIWGYEILIARLGYRIEDIHPDLANPEQVYDLFKREPELARMIWAMCTPPNSKLVCLKKPPRFVELPEFKREYGMFHYFAHRDDILRVGGDWDERHWTALWTRTRRPRMIDTWSLVYHYCWCPWRRRAQQWILPIIEETIW